MSSVPTTADSGILRLYCMYGEAIYTEKNFLVFLNVSAFRIKVLILCMYSVEYDNKYFIKFKFEELGQSNITFEFSI